MKSSAIIFHRKSILNNWTTAKSGCYELLKLLRNLLAPNHSERIANLAERDIVLHALDEEGQEILYAVSGL